MSCARNAILVLLSVAACPEALMASPCVAPERPFLPQSSADMRLYADLLRADFETYIADVQVYFRCLDAERARAFTEARDVSEDYGRFQRAQD
jgi:hypothetical protein